LGRHRKSQFCGKKIQIFLRVGIDNISVTRNSIWRETMSTFNLPVNDEPLLAGEDIPDVDFRMLLDLMLCPKLVVGSLTNKDSKLFTPKYVKVKLTVIHNFEPFCYRSEDAIKTMWESKILINYSEGDIMLPRDHKQEGDTTDARRRQIAHRIISCSSRLKISRIPTSLDKSFIRLYWIKQKETFVKYKKDGTKISDWNREKVKDDLRCMLNLPEKGFDSLFKQTLGKQISDPVVRTRGKKEEVGFFPK
jgi:hypothetical protein